jgi:hypothetical protein
MGPSHINYLKGKSHRFPAQLHIAVVVYDVLRNSDDSTPRDFSKIKKNAQQKLKIGFLSFVSLFGCLEKTNTIPNKKKKKKQFCFVSFLVFFYFEASEVEDDDDNQQRRSVMRWYTWAVCLKGSSQVLTAKRNGNCKKEKKGWRRLYKWVWPNWLHPVVVSRRVRSLCPVQSVPK